MKDFWENNQGWVWVVALFVGLILLMMWASAADEKRCTEKFGGEWHSNSYNSRYGGPQCVNDKGEGKWL